MIYLLYGEDIVGSLKFLEDLKDNKDLIWLENTEDPNVLKYSFSQKNLFEKKQIFVIEDFLKNEKSIKILADVVKDETLVIWEKRDLPQKFITKTPPHFKKVRFQPKKEIFQLLQDLRPKNDRTILWHFNSLLSKGENPQLFFYLLLKHLRLLIMAKNPQNLKKEGLPRWRLERLVSQSSYFSEDELIANFKKLVEIDYQMKSSVSPFNLPDKIFEFLRWL